MRARLTPHLQKPRRYVVTPGFCFLSLKGRGKFLDALLEAFDEVGEAGLARAF